PQKSLEYTHRLQTKTEVTGITVTSCPPGCGNKCSRVFEDSMGLGYKVYCECPMCHTDKIDLETK
ncbi:MAG TPA: hypothetical protein VGE97_03225, partial [Nitrososphaera sp.]